MNFIDNIKTSRTEGPFGAVLTYTLGAAHTSSGDPAAEDVFAAFTLPELLDAAGAPEAARAAFAGGEVFCNPGGWQSWSAGWELCPGERLSTRVLLMKALATLTARPGDEPAAGEVTGNFIAYFRAGDWRLCVASTGEDLAPVSYRITLAGAGSRLRAEAHAPGKVWAAGEKAAELAVFCVEGYFNFKDAIAAIYRQGERFAALSFLCKKDGAPPDFLHDKKDIPGGYTSWYNHYTKISEQVISADLEDLEKGDNLIRLRYIDRRRPVIFQIDDGWERAVGDWEPDAGRFPGGMAPVAAKITAKGCIPGLWLAPFLVTRRAPIYAERPGWLLRDGAGRPVSAGWNPNWDGVFYCLDISRPDVLDYLASLTARAASWGFRYLKLDFLYAGLLPGAFSTPGAPYEHYRKAIDVLTGNGGEMWNGEWGIGNGGDRESGIGNRESKGRLNSDIDTRLPTPETETPLPTPHSPLPTIAFLGCGLPLGLSYRQFPLSRIGADTRETWDWRLAALINHNGRPSAVISMMDTIGRSFLNGTVFLNDPDVIFLRSANCTLTGTEKETIALVNFLLAGQILSSDDSGALTAADYALARRINGLYDALEGDDYGAWPLAPRVYRLESRSGRFAGIINLSDRKFILNSLTNPELYGTMCGGKALVDHRLDCGAKAGAGAGGGAIGFAPHSVTIIMR